MTLTTTQLADPKFTKGDVVFVWRIDETKTVVAPYVHKGAEWSYHLVDENGVPDTGWLETELVRVPRSEGERDQMRAETSDYPEYADWLENQVLAP